MLSLLKKLFAKKEDRPVAPWPFPTGKVKIETPVPEVKPMVAAVAKPKKVANPKPAVAAKASTRKPRAKKV